MGNKTYFGNNNIKETPLYPLLNPTNEGVVLNENFKRWDHIEKRVLNRGIQGDEYYRDFEDRALLEFAKAHVREYRRKEKADTWITMTHSFYLFMSHANELKFNSQREDANRYAENLMKLLGSNLSRDKINIVLFETLHHYAAATSRLLEQGFVDDVFFTEYDSGYLLDKNELQPKPERSYLCAGAYNGRCFSNSLEELADITRGDNGKISIIQDMILNAPFTPWTMRGLSPDKSEIRLASSMCAHLIPFITVDEIIKKFGK